MAAKRAIRLIVNGQRREGEAEPRKLLSDFIREDLGLTGTHVGCEHGVCGACTILLDGEPVRSCLLFAVQAEGHELLTVEGLAPAVGAQGFAPAGAQGVVGAQRVAPLHPIQEAFWECHGLQCGFCTPGFLLTIKAYLEENPSPTEREVREALSGNLCRCTGYQNIVKATLRAAELLRGEPASVSETPSR